jgi:hypothetical protein
VILEGGVRALLRGQTRAPALGATPWPARRGCREIDGIRLARACGRFVELDHHWLTRHHGPPLASGSSSPASFSSATRAQCLR